MRHYDDSEHLHMHGTHPFFESDRDDVRAGGQPKGMVDADRSVPSLATAGTNALLAFDDRGVVAGASTAAWRALGRQQGDVVGLRLVDLLGPMSLPWHPDHLPDWQRQPRFETVYLDQVGRRLAVLHRTAEGYGVAELVSCGEAEASAGEQLVNEVTRLLGSASMASDTNGLLSSVVRSCRDLLGFERVLACSLLSDGTGQVIAESAEPSLEPLLGASLPSSCVPSAARAEAVQRPVQAWGSARALMIELETDPSGPVVDLRGTSLLGRPVTAIAEPGAEPVASRVAVGIVVDERLWGLVVMQSGSAREGLGMMLPSLWTVSRLLSVQVAANEHARVIEGRTRATQVHEIERAMLSSIGTAGGLSRALEAQPPAVLRLLDADGVAIRCGEERFKSGLVPCPDNCKHAVTRLIDLRGSELVWSSDLAREIDLNPATLDGLGGVLAIRFSTEPLAVIAWYRRQGPDGRCRPWQKSEIEVARVLRDSMHNVVLRVSRLMLEVEQRRKAELRLRQINDDLEAFAYAAGHDLREPLRSMTMMMELMERHLRRGEVDRALSDVSRAMDSSKRMRSLIDAVQRLTRTSTQAIALERVDLSDVVREVAEDQRLAAGVDELTLRADELPTLTADRKLLTRLVANVLNNAMKFRRAGVALEVTVSAELSPDGQSWDIRFSDNGSGIDPRHVERVLRAFERGGADRSVEGRGLGLSICRRVAERHGGSLRLSSDPALGTTVTVVWPKEPVLGL